jgi:hypothetical protein
MNRALISLFTLCIFVAPAAFAQDSTNPLFSSSLIAWTNMQTPQPVPEGSPRPTPPTPEPHPDTQVAPSTPTSPDNPSSETSKPDAAGDRAQTEPAAQTFTGTVGKEADTYVLKLSESTAYKLDDQDQAKQYAGQRVRVLGTLDVGSAQIHVQKIEPLS